jgi:hypothetical protein
VYLYLCFDMFDMRVGTISEAFTSFPSIQILRLDFNNFVGTIPESLCYSTSLETLSLGNNTNLNCYPSCLDDLSLNSLDMGSMSPCPVIHPLCNFIAATDISNLAGYSQWACSEDSLSAASNPCDPLALWPGLNCTSDGIVDRVALGSVGLTGTLPSDIGGLLAGMTIVDLSDNKLFGTLPHSLGDAGTLSGLGLHINCFSGTIPSTLGQLTDLTALSLKRNSFSGTLPVELGSLSKLTGLALHQNQELNGKFNTVHSSVV